MINFYLKLADVIEADSNYKQLKDLIPKQNWDNAKKLLVNTYLDCDLSIKERVMRRIITRVTTDTRLDITFDEREAKIEELLYKLLLRFAKRFKLTEKQAYDYKDEICGKMLSKARITP